MTRSINVTDLQSFSLNFLSLHIVVDKYKIVFRLVKCFTVVCGAGRSQVIVVLLAQRVDLTFTWRSKEILSLRWPV